MRQISHVLPILSSLSCSASNYMLAQQGVHFLNCICNAEQLIMVGNLPV